MSSFRPVRPPRLTLSLRLLLWGSYLWPGPLPRTEVPVISTFGCGPSPLREKSNSGPEGVPSRRPLLSPRPLRVQRTDVYRSIVFLLFSSLLLIGESSSLVSRVFSGSYTPEFINVFGWGRSWVCHVHFRTGLVPGWFWGSPVSILIPTPEGSVRTTPELLRLRRVYSFSLPLRILVAHFLMDVQLNNSWFVYF